LVVVLVNCCVWEPRKDAVVGATVTELGASRLIVAVAVLTPSAAL
jgi:hypothetical protein